MFTLLLNTWQQATGKIGKLTEEKLNLEDSMVCVEDPRKIVLELLQFFVGLLFG